MTAPDRSAGWRVAARALAACAFLSAPGAVRAELRLLDHGLELPPALQGAPGSAEPSRPDLSVLRLAEGPPAEDGLDFDLLGPPPTQPPPPEGGSQRRRRLLLGLHQAAGLGLLGLQLATTTAGQLNYDDRFGGPSTARYQATHKVLAYSTLGAFAATGLLALLAPAPPVKKSAKGSDRMTIHKLAMATAAAGMVAQGALGVATRNREGYLDQQRMARVHLAVGYLTLTAVLIGVGAVVLQ
jgi:hypothetical protein